MELEPTSEESGFCYDQRNNSVSLSCPLLNTSRRNSLAGKIECWKTKRCQFFSEQVIVVYVREATA
jgi:hypothetical protein